MISFHSHNDRLIVLLIMTSVGSGNVIWRQTMMPTLVRVVTSLQRRHNERDVVSNHQPHDCLLNYLFRRTSKKTSKLRVSLAIVWGIHRGPVNSPHKWPVTRKMFPFYDVIMQCEISSSTRR